MFKKFNKTKKLKAEDTISSAFNSVEFDMKSLIKKQQIRDIERIKIYFLFDLSPSMWDFYNNGNIQKIIELLYEYFYINNLNVIYSYAYVKYIAELTNIGFDNYRIFANLISEMDVEIGLKSDYNKIYKHLINNVLIEDFYYLIFNFTDACDIAIPLLNQNTINVNLCFNKDNSIKIENNLNNSMEFSINEKVEFKRNIIENFIIV